MVACHVFIAARAGSPIRQLPEGLDIRDGDILLLGSTTLRGRILRCLEQGGEWGHVGLLAVAQNGSIEIIHADPEFGVVRQPLAEYLRENKVDALMLLRPVGNNGGGLAVAYVERTARSNAPFNNSFRYKSGSGYYCTELVLLAWECAGVVLLPNARRGDRIPPSELLTSPELACQWQQRASQ